MKKQQTQRIYRTFEIMWLAIIAISIVEAVRNWNVDTNRVVIFAVFAAFGTFRYFYSRRQRARMKNKMND